MTEPAEPAEPADCPGCGGPCVTVNVWRVTVQAAAEPRRLGPITAAVAALGVWLRRRLGGGAGAR